MPYGGNAVSAQNWCAVSGAGPNSASSQTPKSKKSTMPTFTPLPVKPADCQAAAPDSSTCEPWVGPVPTASRCQAPVVGGTAARRVARIDATSGEPASARIPAGSIRACTRVPGTLPVTLPPNMPTATANSSVRSPRISSEMVRLVDWGCGPPPGWDPACSWASRRGSVMSVSPVGAEGVASVRGVASPHHTAAATSRAASGRW